MKRGRKETYLDKPLLNFSSRSSLQFCMIEAVLMLAKK